jgi:hypothetical protein
LPEDRATAIFIEVLGDRSLGRARRGVISALRGSDAKPAVPALSRMLEDPDPTIRQSSAFTLGLLRDPRAADALERCLAVETDWRAEYDECAALSCLGRPCLQYLLWGLHDADKHKRELAFIALVQIGDVRALPEVDRALQDKNASDYLIIGDDLWKTIGTSNRNWKPYNDPETGRPIYAWSVKPAAEVSQAVEKWMQDHPDQVGRAIEPSLKRWMYTAPPPLLVDQVKKLRAGMKWSEFEALMPPQIQTWGGTTFREELSYGPDPSGRTLHGVTGSSAESTLVLARWKLSDLPLQADEAVTQLGQADDVSIRLERWSWKADYKSAAAQAILQVSAGLEGAAAPAAKADAAGALRVPRPEAKRLIDAAADEGFFTAAKITDDRGPPSTLVLRINRYWAPVGPDMTTLRLLDRMKAAAEDAALVKALDAALAEVRTELGIKE